MVNGDYREEYLKTTIGSHIVANSPISIPNQYIDICRMQTLTIFLNIQLQLPYNLITTSDHETATNNEEEKY